MLPWEDTTAYGDVQQERHLDFCPCCGRERYAPSYFCIRCQGWPV